MADMNGFLWSPGFWLPQNVTWKDFQDDSMHLPHIRDLLVCIPLTGALLLLRFLLERLVIFPMGRAVGVSERSSRQPVQNDTLESAFKKYKRIIPSHEALQGLSKQTDMSLRQIERWWRLRRVMDKPSEMKRLGETSWRFLFYLSIFIYGCKILWRKPYVLDTWQCWYGYPKQDVSDFYWYITLEISFYASLMVSAVNDNKRKDFAEMMLHHSVAVVLFSFTWLINVMRICVMAIVVTDSADYFLEAAKAANYLKFKKLPDLLFAAFTIIWFISRLVILPFWIIRSSLFESIVVLGGPFGGYYLLNGMFLVLQALHIYWFTFIVRILYHYIILKKDLKDNRSDTDPDSEKDEPVDEIPKNGSNAFQKQMENNNHNPTENDHFRRH